MAKGTALQDAQGLTLNTGCDCPLYLPLAAAGQRLCCSGTSDLHRRLALEGPWPRSAVHMALSLLCTLDSGAGEEIQAGLPGSEEQHVGVGEEADHTLSSPGWAESRGCSLGRGS